MLLSAISAEAIDINWTSMAISTLTGSSTSLSPIFTLYSLFDGYKELDRYFEEQAKQRKAELQNQIDCWEQEIKDLNSFKQAIKQDIDLCEITFKFLNPLIESQIEEAQEHINAAKVQNFPSFEEEIKHLSVCAHFEKLLLDHISQCPKCLSSSSCVVLMEKYAADKEIREQHLKCILEWQKEGYNSKSEKEREQIFQKRLDYALKLSGIIKNISEILK